MQKTYLLRALRRSSVDRVVDRSRKALGSNPRCNPSVPDDLFDKTRKPPRLRGRGIESGRSIFDYWDTPLGDVTALV